MSSDKKGIKKALIAIIAVIVFIMMALKLSGIVMKDHYNAILLSSALTNKTTSARVVLFLGADANAEDSRGFTALELASREGNYDIANMLIKKGAQINHLANTNNRDLMDWLHYGWSPLHIAAKNGRCKIVSLLIKNGADVNIHPKDDYYYYDFMTPLEGMSDSEVWDERPFDMEECMRTLIENGADIMQQSKISGYALVHELSNGSTSTGRIKTLQMILAYGAGVNIRDNEGRTPLMYAAEGDDSLAAKVLLDYGADIWAKDKQGRTALVIAKAADPFGRGTFEVAKLIAEEMNRR